MKNSTKWCNLYSSESKYKLAFTSSKIAKKIPLYLTAFFLLLLFLVLSVLNPSQNTIYIAAFVLILVLPLYLLIGYFFNKQIQASFLLNKNVLLSHSGELTSAADEHWQITSASFIVPFGCSLVLECEQQKRYAWVFQDSLSNTSFRRLCRAVIRQKAIN